MTFGKTIWQRWVKVRRLSLGRWHELPNHPHVGTPHRPKTIPTAELREPITLDSVTSQRIGLDVCKSDSRKSVLIRTSFLEDERTRCPEDSGQYVAGAFTMVVFALYVYVFPGWMIKTGSVLCILTMLNVVWLRHHRAAARRMPEDPAAALVDFHRSELVRHPDAVGGSWL
jgi:hypothetical protein